MDIEALKQLLEANGVDSAKYDNNTLQTLINQAITLINIPELTNTVHNEYEDAFTGKMYVTRYSPINIDDVVVHHGDTIITPKKVTTAGVIYFETYIHGELEISYNTGIPSTEVDNCINLIVLYMIQEIESKTDNGIVNSITEGDVSVSYNTTAYGDKINNYISELKSNYASAQVFYM